MKTFNVCSTRDGKLEFHRRGTLCSGVMYTSLCGVVLTMLMLGGCAKSLGVKGFRMISAGDDTNPILPLSESQRYCEALPGYCRQFGFSVKVDAVSPKLEDIEFCRSKPVFDGLGYRMVRFVGPALIKDLMSTKLQPGERNWRKRLAAIGSCGMALCGGMPVMQSFYAMMLRAGRGETGSLDEPYGGMARMARGMSYVYSEPSVAARVSFHAAFGLDAADQVRLERAYDRVTMRYGSPDDLRHTVCSLFRI